MTLPRDSVTVLYIVWEGYGNQSMNNFIEQTKAGNSVRLCSNVRHPIGIEQSEWHLPANHSCCLSSEQLFAGLVQFGKSTLVSGSYTAEAYSSCGLTRVLYAVSRTFDILVLIVRRTKPSVRLAFPVIRSTCGFQEREPEISTPRYLALVINSKTCPCCSM